MADVDESHEDIDSPQRSCLKLQEPSPDEPLSCWGSLMYTAQWYTQKVVRTVTNVHKSVVEPYEIYDSIVREILTSRLLLPEDRAYVESVLTSEVNLATVDEERKWPETYRRHCLVSTLAVFAILLCLRRSSKIQLLSLVTALGLTASKFLSVSMLKLSVLQLTPIQSMQSCLLKWALVQIKDDESLQAGGSHGHASSSRQPESTALVEIETIARADSKLFARTVFETIQSECLLWQAVTRDIRTAILEDDVELIMPVGLDDCRVSCPKLFCQPESIEESTDNYSYGAVHSLKTLNDLHRSECLRNLCLGLVQRCALSMKSVFLCKKALESVVALQGKKYDFLCRQYSELKAKQSSLFTRLNTQLKNGNIKSKYSDCDVSVRMLCTNLERCLQLATAIHYEIQEGQDQSSALSVDAINEMIEILNGNLTQSVSFSADLQVRVTSKRTPKPTTPRSASRHASIESHPETPVVDLASLPSEPAFDEVYVGKSDCSTRNDEVDCSRDLDDREACGASLAPPVLNQLKDVLKLKEAERITREAAAMKRLGLEEPSSSSSEDDEDTIENEPMLRSVGHTGFEASLAAQVAARAALAADDFVYDSDEDND
ncbi:uncharacterized protein LOC114828503 [Galendromus occidentalis]|uniref:Uncharacterized protein LOC114828503 n=1 Tax=Galendromus occidentalis TaxID=34638 RepID=A0AAJ7SHS3_9ACAR|nr:uncharacterized protein LOC114828503 [Galendromus occidentalis]